MEKTSYQFTIEGGANGGYTARMGDQLATGENPELALRNLSNRIMGLGEDALVMFWSAARRLETGKESTAKGGQT